MLNSTRVVRCVAVLALLVWSSGLAGCRTRPQPAPPPPVEEKSIQPGVNNDYLKPDLNVLQVIETFERTGREVFDKRDEIVRALRIRPGIAIADVGAGTGLFTFLLSDWVGPEGRVYALDISPPLVELIQKRAAQAGVSNVQALVCTDRSVELPPDFIDLAFLCDVYHHFEYPHSSLASLYQALRPQGELVLIDFKRVPGQSTEWTLTHVRAGQEEFTREIEAAGFKKVEELNILKEAYFLRFKKIKK